MPKNIPPRKIIRILVVAAVLSASSVVHAQTKTGTVAAASAPKAAVTKGPQGPKVAPVKAAPAPTKTADKQVKAAVKAVKKTEAPATVVAKPTHEVAKPGAAAAKSVKTGVAAPSPATVKSAEKAPGRPTTAKSAEKTTASPATAKSIEKTPPAAVVANETEKTPAQASAAPGKEATETAAKPAATAAKPAADPAVKPAATAAKTVAEAAVQPSAAAEKAAAVAPTSVSPTAPKAVKPAVVPAEKATTAPMAARPVKATAASGRVKLQDQLKALVDQLESAATEPGKATIVTQITSLLTTELETVEARLESIQASKATNRETLARVQAAHDLLNMRRGQIVHEEESLRKYGEQLRQLLDNATSSPGAKPGSSPR